MADWDDMRRNLAESGGFRGRSAAQEDAYFSFFEGGTPWTGLPVGLGFIMELLRRNPPERRVREGQA